MVQRHSGRSVALLRLGRDLLQANRPRLVILAAGAASAALAASALILASATSIAVVQQTVADGWRGTYDLLVRPNDAPTLTLADGSEVVPAAFSASPTSGISRREWEQILAIPGVGVAAPISCLGWVKRADAGVAIVLPVEAEGSVIHITGWAGSKDAPLATYDAFASADNSFAGPIFAPGIVDLGTEGDEIILTVGFLPPTWGNVVGIDPGEEDRLVGLRGEVTGSYLPDETSRAFDQTYAADAMVIPVLASGPAPYPGNLHIRVDRLSDTGALRARETFNQLMATAQSTGVYPTQEAVIDAVSTAVGDNFGKLTSVSTPLRRIIDPLGDKPVVVKDGLARTSTEGTQSAGARNVLLVPGPAQYVRGSTPDTFSLAPLGTWQEAIAPQLQALQPENFNFIDSAFGTDDTIYRTLTVAQPEPFVVSVVGSFDAARVAGGPGLTNYVPLGAYVDPTRELLRDANGLAAPSGTQLPLSMNPGGINPLPPVGLTNLAASEAVRGTRFIDAIRIRVSGIDGYSSEAVARIESVAQRIIQQTGLRVDVVAGSAPVTVPVEVDGVGVVGEQWTSTGFVARVESATNGISGSMLWAAAAAALLYVVVFGISLGLNQRREIVILRLIGWSRVDIVGLLATQAAVVGSATAAATITITAALAMLGGLGVGAGALIAGALGIIALHVVAGVCGGLLATRALASTDIRGEAVSTRTHGIGFGLIRVAIAGVTASPWVAALGIIVLAMSATLAGLLAVAMLAFGGRLDGSAFGQLITLRVGPYHFLAAAAATAAAGALAMTLAVLTVERQIGFIGLLRALGWTRVHVSRLLLIETVSPGVAAGLTAGTVTFVAGWVADLGTLSTVVAMGAALIAVSVSWAAASPAIAAALASPPAVTLEADGASRVVPGMSTRTAFVGVVFLVVASVVGTGGWAVAFRADRAGVAFASPRPSQAADPRSAALLSTIRQIVAKGDRAAGTENAEAIRSYLEIAMGVTGMEMMEVPFVARNPTFLDASGEPLDREDVASSVIPLSLAYPPEALEQAALTERIVGTDVTGTAGDPPCAPGVMLIRVDGDANAGLAAATQQRCAGTAQATLAVLANDEAEWAALPERVASVSFPVERHVVFVPEGGVQAGTPWIVAPLSSRGPGATQSAAPVAVALMLAKQASDAGVQVRIAFVWASDGSAASSFIRFVAASTPGPMLWLGPMGGAAPMSAGTTVIAATTSADAVRAGLLSTLTLDERAADWLAATEDLSTAPTSQRLLELISAATGFKAGPALGGNGFALAMGFDAAYVGEDALATGGLPSVAGTPSDSADVVNGDNLVHLVDALLDALRALGS